MITRLISVTPDADYLIAYCARVSSPNQDSDKIEGLLKYCIRHGHWSIFEMADMTVEITTSRAIAAQLLRHRSFNFQEFSQRYSAATNFEIAEARSQDLKNRQSSHDDLPDNVKIWFRQAQELNNLAAMNLYQFALNIGIAKECARFLLPLSVQTRLYMKGSVRSWIHYLQVRTAEGTQKEHRDIANAIKELFITEFPTISAALYQSETEIK